MEKEEFEQLEKLIDKLQMFLGYNCCIVPNHVQDGFYIGLYDEKGDLFVETGWVDLKSTAERAKASALEKKSEMEALKQKTYFHR